VLLKGELVEQPGESTRSASVGHRIEREPVGSGDLDRAARGGIHRKTLSVPGRLKKNVLPAPGWDSTQI
jgi:hypothetical protein